MGHSWPLACFVFVLWVCIFGCSAENTDYIEPTTEHKSPLFRLLSPEESGVTFTNSITENYDINIINYDYLYNGGGVGIGDFDNDGLEDVFFTGNQTPDRLYHNQGGMKFEDITAASGLLASVGWSTGVAVADVNRDGWLDIYISKSGPSENESDRTNQLFINNGDLTFTESAEEWGLNYTGHSTQALFFDFDRDGDLDMYLLTHPAEFSKGISGREIQQLLDEGKLESDHFYRNDQGYFTDISEKAGIGDFAFGLGIACGDLNDDGWPDLYVSNDFDEGDLLYINNRDGTFSNRATSILRHTANYGMGCDIADFNNDGLADIMSVDMAFESHKRAKMNMSSMDLERFEARVKLGWHYQYMSNMLHLNLGGGRFTEIAQVAGVQKTDWSWSCLFADFDLDGYQDILVTNGYKRDTKDNDLQHRINRRQQEKGGAITIDEALETIPATKLKNYWFRNKGDLTFERMGKNWGIDQSVNSNGAAYADFDNDGDLDVVINNMDEVAFIYENGSKEKDYLKIELVSTGLSEGAEVAIFCEDEIMMRRNESQRGFQSSVSNKIHFGISKKANPFLITVLWNDGWTEVWEYAGCNKTMTLERGTGGLQTDRSEPSIRFTKTKDLFGGGWIHRENSFNDFEIQVLLPHKLSQLGPFIAKGDINGDGAEDVYVGGASGQAGVVYFQNETGWTPSNQPVLLADAVFEDMRAEIFDANGDGWNDLLVTSGGQEFSSNEAYQVRLYLNDGRGRLTADLNFPSIQQSMMGLHVADIDADGDEDIILGGRMVPGLYLLDPHSYILKNESGVFVDVTNDLAPGLANLGLITDITSGDVDGDGLLDIVCVGEWMAPTVLLQNNEGKFAIDESMIPQKQEGWWYSAELVDIDGDGDLDLLAGNLGLNNKFHPSEDKPLRAFASDFDENGTHDFVLAKYESSTLYPVRGRECSSEQMPFILDKYPTYEQFAEASFDEMFSKKELEGAITRSVYSFESGIFYNENGQFRFQAFPLEAQFAPINGILPKDVNGDGVLDLIMAGNLYQAEVETTRYDGGSGLVLIQKKGEWQAEGVGRSGFFTSLDVKDIELVRSSNGKEIVIVTNNNGPLQIFTFDPASDSKISK